MKKTFLFTALSVGIFASAATSHAAVLAFAGGGTASGTITGTPGNFVLDAGFKAPSTNSTNPVIFETGGDGIGTTLALVGNNLEVFQDQNSGAEPTLTLDISAFFGQTISIRLDGDYRPASGSRLLSLDVVPTIGAPLSISLTDIATADTRFSGGDGTGFGGVNGTLGGNGEGASPVSGFDNADRDLAGPGASVLGASELEGSLYNDTDADTQRVLPIPLAAAYFVPEPSAVAFILLGRAGQLLRRRR